MLTLGIETSCDETSASVVEDGRKILSQSIISSLSYHRQYGGVVPEIASRMHAEKIGAVVDNSLKEAGINIRDIGLIAVTKEPGLISSLLVGFSFAKAVSFSLNKPLMYLDHIQAHLYANFLENKFPKTIFPFVGLVVSGGHTCLFLVRSFKNIKIIGSTLDDACGEAFDKVAKILGLGYPGGVAIENLVMARDFERINFSCGREVKGLDFSFSGIKTSVLYHVMKNKVLTHQQKINIAASFQEAAVESLIEKSSLACRKNRIKTLIVGGGVAANNLLRKKLFELKADKGIKAYFPPKNLCTDNAAMVAGLGCHLYRN